MNTKTLITGFPRIGKNRELKKALEQFWSGKITLEQLQKTSAQLRKEHLTLQKEKGIQFISCNDFSWYDQMLDTCIMLNAIPARFRHITDSASQYFAMARGNDDVTAMEMTKWFNTNYHFIVPELEDTNKFQLNPDKIIEEYTEAIKLDINAKINLIGPVTFLALSKKDKEASYYFENILAVYEELLQKLSKLNVKIYIQFDEPYFATDPTDEYLELLKKTYEKLPQVADNIKIIVTTYFEHSNEATPILAETPVWGIGLDFVHGIKNLETLEAIKNKHLIAGVVDGRNIWRNDIEESLAKLAQIEKTIPKEKIIISTSCSLLHVPYTLENEPESDIKEWLAFANEKIFEVTLISRLYHGTNLSIDDKISFDHYKDLQNRKKTSAIITDQQVQKRLKNLSVLQREGEFQERNELQREHLQLPLLPTTTIGSFPQTKDVRRLRYNLKHNKISPVEYEQKIQEYIDDCVEFQDTVGLDVLVHGEPERNDMVEYFGELMKGFLFTKKGWVQSYGSRCVKPPVIFGDISRPEAMTVKWITYAQSRSTKPVKGMLTGPVTILNWSFVRNDIPRSEVSKQIALALSDEIDDLQNNGIKIIQVDEAAFREGYPLRKENIKTYEDWAVNNFKLAVSTAKKNTQIHTHMCYSEFNTILDALNRMDADVITIETARSGNELLKSFNEHNYKNEIGPGVYDIHSPRVPSVTEFTQQIEKICEVFSDERLWINPDCGLKTRKWEEVKPALSNMIAATRKFRESKENR